MRKTAFVFSVLVFVSALFAYPQNETAHKEGIIPFELKGHIIFIKGKINDHPEEYNFIVDTGGVTMLDSVTADKLQLKRKGTMVKMNSLDIGNYRIDSVFCVASPVLFKMFETYPGVTIHGLIGSDLLDRFKVTLDYHRKTLVLSNDTSVTGDPQKGFLLKFTHHPVNSAPVLKCKLNGNYEAEAMVDTGQPYPLVLPPDILKKLEISEKGGWIKAKGHIYHWPGTTSRDNYLGRIDSISLGSAEVQNLLAFSAELPSVLSMLLLGRDFLASYITIINYPKDEIRFIPQSGSPIPANEFSFGMQVHLNDGGKISVRGVWTGSPADRAGVAPEDEIVSLNGKTLSGSDLFDLLHQLNDSGIREIRMEIKNAEGQRVLHLKKENLLPER